MDGLTTAILTGVFALAGVGLGEFLRLFADRRRHARDAVERSWQARRDAYLGLFEAMDRLESELGGMIASRHAALSAETARHVRGAVSHAEFHAPPDVWARMDPLVTALSAAANQFAMLGGRANTDQLAETRQLLDDLDARSTEGRRKLRDEMLAAAREDLGLNRGAR